MPIAQLPGDLLMHYDDDDFTDPWARAPTVILHHADVDAGRRVDVVLLLGQVALDLVDDVAPGPEVRGAPLADEEVVAHRAG